MIGCKYRLLLYFALYVLFANSALFHVVFRTVLIRFPQRGLVYQGRPNLTLFNQLFWVILIPYCFIGIAMFPLRSIIIGTFPNAFRAKLCLTQPVLEKNIMAQNIVPMITQFLWSVFCWYWTFKVNRFVDGVCPDKKMSSIGKYRRNFTTFSQTTRYIKINYYYLLFHQGLIFSLIQAAFTMTPEANFHISAICDFFYINVYHGIFLPLTMVIPSKRKRQTHCSDFFVRKPQFLEARCPEHSETYPQRKSPNSALTCRRESMETVIVNVKKVESLRKNQYSKTSLGHFEAEKIELCQPGEIEHFSKKNNKWDEISSVGTPVVMLVTQGRRGKERTP